MATRRGAWRNWGAVVIAVAALAVFAAAGLALADPWGIRPWLPLQLPHPAGLVLAIAGAGWGFP